MKKKGIDSQTFQICRSSANHISSRASRSMLICQLIICLSFGMIYWRRVNMALARVSNDIQVYTVNTGISIFSFYRYFGIFFKGNWKFGLLKTQYRYTGINGKTLRNHIALAGFKNLNVRKLLLKYVKKNVKYKNVANISRNFR